MSEKKVTITVSGNQITVDPDPVQPKKNQDNVKWECNQQFSVSLQGNTIQGQQQGNKYAGSSGTFPTVEKIKYSVTVGGNELDPEVDVQPGP